MTSSGSGERVVIDPDDLRRVATRMRGGAEMLSSAGRHLATRSRPSMPVGLESRVADVLQEANRELQELALELVQEAGEIMGRAAEAELGGIDSIAWLMPRLHGVLSLSDPESEAVSSSGHFLEGRPPSSQRWAEAALDDITVPSGHSDEPPLDLGEFADVLNALSHLDEIPRAGVMLDLDAEAGTDAQPETGTARGALGVALDELEVGPTGIGLIGCLLAGSAGDPDDSAGSTR